MCDRCEFNEANLAWNKGDKVIAIRNKEGNTVYSYGPGTYEGEFIPDSAAGPQADDCREFDIPNPKITLDSGKTVWGCECWWGPPDTVNNICKGCEIVQVDVDESRRKYVQKAN
jgi:hypothetical protein